MSGGENQKINLGTGKGNSVKEVIETARKVTGHSIPAIESARREGDPAKLVANPALAKEVLGWEAEHDIEEVVQSAWKWHKKK